MKPVAPYFLRGAAGNTLGDQLYKFGDLDVKEAVFKQRSFDYDELSFQIRDNGNRLAIPDDEQWISLVDANGKRWFTGIAKRSFMFPERVYGFTCHNVYKALAETPFLGSDGRGYVVYAQGDVMLRLREILLEAQAIGLPIQPPEVHELPTGYLVPRQVFRATTFATAFEEAAKWVPDLTTRMDYSTSPPTLRFYCRVDEEPFHINLYSAANKTSHVELESWPEGYALAISFAYARRNGDDVIEYLVQSAGDDTAEARRKQSIFLSGNERTDLLISESLTTAQNAVATAQAAVDAVGADIDAAAASAQIQLTWASLYPRDSNLVGAVAAQSAYTMSTAGPTYTLYTGIGCGGGSPWTGTTSINTDAITLRNLDYSPASGWYPIESGAFSDAELATAGATKASKILKGDFISLAANGSAGASYLESNAPSKTASITGYTQAYTSNCANTSNFFAKYLIYDFELTVDAIDMAPTAVAAAVKAAAAAGSSALISRAEFVEAPPNLASNYFERQNWMPYRGNLTYTPGGDDVPEAGDFISITGEHTPREWESMKVPVQELAMDLTTGIPRYTIGPPPRTDFASLLDRLRIPPEDNTEPG